MALLGAALLLATAAPARAVDVHIQSETLAQGYQLITSGGDVLRRSRLNQFLGLDVLDMMGDRTNSISFVSSFRFDSDFGITDPEADSIDALKNNNLSIMFAYFDFRRLGGMFDVRLGRQLLIDDMDFTMFDGLRFAYHTPVYFGIEVVAGLEVKNAGTIGVISSTQLEVDGDGAFDGAEDDELGIVVGGSLFLEGLRDHHGKLGYRRIMTTDGDPDAERVFFNYGFRILPQLHVSAAAAWDFVISDLSDVRAEIRAPKLADFLDIEFAFWRLVPSFEGSSIFNVFSIQPMNDLDLRFRFHIARNVNAYVGGYLRLFGNEKDADDTVDEDGVKDWGARAGGRIKLGAGHIGLDASHQGGYGDMTVIDLFGGYAFLDRTLGLDGRLTTVVFEDSVQEQLSATSFGAQIGISYRLARLAKFHLISEINTNRIETVQFRMFGLVDLDFWL